MHKQAFLKNSPNINSNISEHCISIPFFKIFFQGYEDELNMLGFFENDYSMDIQKFFSRLDNYVKIILLPKLSENDFYL